MIQPDALVLIRQQANAFPCLNKQVFTTQWCQLVDMSELAMNGSMQQWRNQWDAARTRRNRKTSLGSGRQSACDQTQVIINGFAHPYTC
jgi:hypothetical protein